MASNKKAMRSGYMQQDPYVSTDEKRYSLPAEFPKTRGEIADDEAWMYQFPEPEGILFDDVSWEPETFDVTDIIYDKNKKHHLEEHFVVPAFVATMLSYLTSNENKNTKGKECVDQYHALLANDNTLNPLSKEGYKFRNPVDELPSSVGNNLLEFIKGISDFTYSATNVLTRTIAANIALYGITETKNTIHPNQLIDCFETTMIFVSSTTTDGIKSTRFSWYRMNDDDMMVKPDEGSYKSMSKYLCARAKLIGDELQNKLKHIRRRVGDIRRDLDCKDRTSFEILVMQDDALRRFLKLSETMKTVSQERHFPRTWSEHAIIKGGDHTFKTYDSAQKTVSAIDIPSELVFGKHYDVRFIIPPFSLDLLKIA